MRTAAVAKPRTNVFFITVSLPVPNRTVKIPADVILWMQNETTGIRHLGRGVRLTPEQHSIRT
jgi:hypothetical protein